MKLLPVPSFFNPNTVGTLYRVPYAQRAAEATKWAKDYDILPSSTDRFRVALVGIDVMDTFCNIEGELFVGGRSGRGAVDDNIRVCRFLYENLRYITDIYFTLDTHETLQIFHPAFWVDRMGNAPAPYTTISYQEVLDEEWQISPQIAAELGYGEYEFVKEYALFYTKSLMQGGKYALTIWPYHAMLGGVGYSLDSAVHEAAIFHSLVRFSQTHFVSKGRSSWTENYSALRPEVQTGPFGERLGFLNTTFTQELLRHDAIIFFGQAKSHCVAWTIEDFLNVILLEDPTLASRVYLLEDATSAVAVPDKEGGFAIDYTDQADAAFARFQNAGMHVVKTTDPLPSWPGIRL